MDTKYSPGPWQIDLDMLKGGHILVHNADYGIAKVYDEEAGMRGVNEANAHLIAAAPMLAEGAQDTVEALKLLRVGLVEKAPETIEVIDAHIDELSYALARARGETA